MAVCVTYPANAGCEFSKEGKLSAKTMLGNQKETVKIGMDKLRKYFPRGTTPQQMEETIDETAPSPA